MAKWKKTVGEVWYMAVTENNVFGFNSLGEWYSGKVESNKDSDFHIIRNVEVEDVDISEIDILLTKEARERGFNQELKFNPDRTRITDNKGNIIMDNGIWQNIE